MKGLKALNIFLILALISRGLTNQLSDSDSPTQIEFEDPRFWIFLALSFVLVLFSGLMSGLTVGYSSIDPLQLEIKIKTGTEEERTSALIVKPLIERHHFLSSTLLVANSFAMETLPIFLDQIVSPIAAIIISVTAVVIFGEIVPQALATGPKQLLIARKCTPIAKLLMFFLWPICYPISKALDCCIGHREDTRMKRNDLKALIELHKHAEGETQQKIQSSVKLSGEEIQVINSTLDLSETPVTKEMKRIANVFILDESIRITEEIIEEIVSSGFSKIPVCKANHKHEIIGFIKVKTLVHYHKKYIGKTIGEAGLMLMKAMVVPMDMSMLELLMKFQKERSSIAVISNQRSKFKEIDFSGLKKFSLVGLICLKDIFEEILEKKLLDDDMHKLERYNSAEPSKSNLGNYIPPISY